MQGCAWIGESSASAGVVADRFNRGAAFRAGPHDSRAVVDAREGKRGVHATPVRSVVDHRYGQHPARPVHGVGGGTMSKQKQNICLTCIR